MQKIPEIKVKRGKIAEERFKVLLGKLLQSQVSNASACAIHKVFKAVDIVQKENHDLFLKIRDQFAKKDDQGKLVAMKDENKNEIPDSWEIIDGKQEDFQNAVNAMGDEEVGVKVKPLTPEVLKDIKISAMEIDLLGDLFVPENGPGLPHMHSV